MNGRLKEIRTRLGYNQNQISEKINVSQAHVSALENGTKTITDRIISDYCREFNVNKEWLETGQGEIFVENDSSILAELITEYKLDDLDSKIIEHYLKLDETDRRVIKKYVTSIAESINFENSLDNTINDEKSEIDVSYEVESYKSELEDVKKVAEEAGSSAYDTTKGKRKPM